MKPMKLLTAGVFAVLAGCLVTLPALAQDWPNRAIKIIVPSAPGDGSDIVARLLSDHLARRLGQSFVVENKPGATVGTLGVATAAPDGYTMIMGNAGSHGINAAVYQKLPYDVERDFAPISLIYKAPNIFVASQKFGVTSLAGLVAKLKAEPGRFNYASGGYGSSANMNAEYLKLLTDTKAQHVPYRGATLALNDILSGQMDFMAVNLPPAIGLVRDNKIVPLAVTSVKRARSLPDVPTVAESGFPGYETVAWFGLLAPANTPAAVIDKMSREIADICATTDMGSKLESLGGELVCTSAAEFKATIASDIARWRQVAAAANLKLD